MELTLERKGQADNGQLTPNISMTPSLGEDYWAYRVVLTEKQAVVGFPKFSTIGIGFAVEADDWNTNLPYTCDADEIASHIAANKGDDGIADADVLAAIKLIQEAATEDRKPVPTKQELVREFVNADGMGQNVLVTRDRRGETVILDVRPGHNSRTLRIVALVTEAVEL